MTPWTVARDGFVLHREFRPVAVAWLDACAARDLWIVVVSCWRSTEKQRELWEKYQERLRLFAAGQIPNPGLPAAEPGGGPHEFGLGLDYGAHSSIQLQEAGELARDTFGLRWGGDFWRMVNGVKVPTPDPVHADCLKTVPLAQVKALFNAAEDLVPLIYDAVPIVRGEPMHTRGR